MSDVKTFLKVLSKVGYPNHELKSIAKMVDYNLDDFIPDLINEIGKDETESFVRKALSKLSTEEGIKVDLAGDYNEYIYVIVHKAWIYIDSLEVFIDTSWGESKLLSVDENGKDSYKTIQEISDEIGMGEWADYDYMIDSIKDQFITLVLNNCGFLTFFD
jgi:hypothetical protein